MSTTIDLRKCTVKLPGLGGQGVLIKGGHVLTASHCFKWNNELGGEATLGEHFPIDIACETGHTFRLGPVFIDPISDLAVLGPLDNQVFPEDCEAFEEFCDQVSALDVVRTMPNVREEIPLKAWSHEGFEIDCVGTLWNPLGGKIMVSGPIRSGTSGGPIVTTNGELIAIVSTAGGINPNEGIQNGTQPIVWRILPEFIREQILAGDE